MRLVSSTEAWESLASCTGARIRVCGVLPVQSGFSLAHCQICVYMVERGGIARELRYLGPKACAQDTDISLPPTACLGLTDCWKQDWRERGYAGLVLGELRGRAY